MRRHIIQVCFTLLTNSYLTGFIEGKIYKGTSKVTCVPGLNCYSCPGAVGSCPIGGLQAVMGSIKYKMSFYVLGLVMLFGTIFGRFVCSYMCPFGLVQDLLYKIKSKKFKLPKIFRWIKYGVLVYFVLLFPLLVTNIIGVGEPGYCKYVCPSGTLFGALPLLLKNQGLRAALGALFNWKLLLLISVLVGSVFIYRIFCQVLCPLGLIYGFFNKFSFLGYHLDHDKCKGCGKCKKACDLHLDPCKDLDSIECIRCGNCKQTCGVQAIERRI